MILPGVMIGGALPSLTRVGSHVYNATGTTTVTFSSVSLGAAGRRHLVFLFGTIGPAATGVTIGGVTATQIESVLTAVNKRSYLYVASVPTGTTGNIVVTFGASTTNVMGALYALYNLRSGTPHDSTSNTGAAANFSTNVNVLDKGLIVGLAASDASTGSGVTGLDNWTQINGTPRVADASRVATANETPRTITWTGYTTGNLTGVCASFR